MALKADVLHDRVPRYIQYAADVMRLICDEGTECTEAARVLSIDPQTGRHAYKIGIRGWRIGQADPNQGKQERAFWNTQGAEVAERRDELDQCFHIIAEVMGVTCETTRKAYNYHHRQVTDQAGDAERLKDMGCNRQMSLTKRQHVRELLRAWLSVNDVVAEVGCSKTVAYREKRKLRA